MKVYYFGCIREAGHYMFKPGENYNEKQYSYSDLTPWGFQIDGALCQEGKQVEGKAILRHLQGWTALSFWDRSVDKRPSSNSNFFAEGEHTFAEMVELASKHFPKVMQRLPFIVTEVKE